jgi:orotate phosphoribosyltransferase
LRQNQIMENLIEGQIASYLLESRAVQLNVEHPFTWASGWKSPIYCDNRLTLSYPQFRTEIKQALANLVKEKFGQVEAIAGVATAGIPQGALVADLLELPFIYVRSKPKGHGMENMIEGKVVTGQKVVLVEDLISTGGSSIKAAKALEAAGLKVLGMVAIFTYGFDAANDNFETANINVATLSNYAAMLEQALKQDYINEDQLVSLKAWRVDPSTWSV